MADLPGRTAGDRRRRNRRVRPQGWRHRRGGTHPRRGRVVITVPRLVVAGAFLAGAAWGVLGQFGCTTCTCPPLADPPALGTYLIVDAPDPSAIGGTLEVVPLHEDVEDYRALVITYAVPDGEVTVNYWWP